MHLVCSFIHEKVVLYSETSLIEYLRDLAHYQRGFPANPAGSYSIQVTKLVEFIGYNQ